MRSLRRLAPIAVLLLAPVLAGCGDDGGDDKDSNEGAPPTSSSPDAPDSSDPATDATEATSDAESSSPAEPVELPGACDVVTADDVGAAYGVEFGTGEVGGGGTSENDVEWQSDNCDWESEGLLEVQLAISGPDDFEGEVTCPVPGKKNATPVQPPGPEAIRAWWIVEDQQPLEATLRLCTTESLVEIGLEFEGGTDYLGDPQIQTTALASYVLTQLG